MNIRNTGLVIAAALALILILLNRQPVQLTSQTNFECKKITANGYEISWLIHLHNSNLLSSTVQEVNEKLLLNGKEIAELQLDLKQGIPGRKETTFPVNVRVAATDIFNDTAIHTSQLPLLLKGEISYSNLTGGGVISVNEVDTVSIQQ